MICRRFSTTNDFLELRTAQATESGNTSFFSLARAEQFGDCPARWRYYIMYDGEYKEWKDG